jgi:uncharacterized protein (TIGR03086 family)
MSEEDIALRHIKVCARFGDAVASANGSWGQPSPCTAWNARGILEHVIGFHDVLLLRPLRAKPDRPRDDPERRWSLTYEALRKLFRGRELFEQIVEVPAVGNNPPARIDARRLVPGLTQDVLVHTWDLARAIGAEDRLDPELCALFYERLPINSSTLTDSGMFEASIALDPDADVQSQLLARLGRDPEWRRPKPEGS